jgi:hypothetical protein
MEKNILNEVNKIRKMMGLNEGRSISGVYYDTTIMHELESIVGNLHKIAPYVLEIGHRVYGTIDGGVSVYEESILVKKFNSVEDFLKGIRYGAQKIENESSNGEMGYNPSPLGEDLSNRTGDLYMDINDLIDEKYKDLDYEDVAKVLENILKGVKAQAYREKNNIGPVTPDEVKKNWASLREADSNETVGIVSDRGKLMAGYFKEGNLVSLGDRILFDVNGNLVKMGGGYPTGGFKNETSVEELEQDICKSYDEILSTLKKDAPVEVSLNESTYEIIKTSVECKL